MAGGRGASALEFGLPVPSAALVTDVRPILWLAGSPNFENNSVVGTRHSFASEIAAEDLNARMAASARCSDDVLRSFRFVEDPRTDIFADVFDGAAAVARCDWPLPRRKGDGRSVIERLLASISRVARGYQPHRSDSSRSSLQLFSLFRRVPIDAVAGAAATTP